MFSLSEFLPPQKNKYKYAFTQKTVIAPSNRKKCI